MHAKRLGHPKRKTKCILCDKALVILFSLFFLLFILFYFNIRMNKTRPILKWKKQKEHTNNNRMWKYKNLLYRKACHCCFYYFWWTAFEPPNIWVSQISRAFYFFVIRKIPLANTDLWLLPIPIRHLHTCTHIHTMIRPE